MTLFQIFAVIQLLLAFNVPAATVADVQGILEASVATSSPALPPDLPPFPGAAHYVPAPEIVPPLPVQANLGVLGNYFASNEFFKDGLYGDVGVREWNYVQNAAQITWYVDGVIVDGPRAPYSGNAKFVLHAGALSNGQHTLSMRAEGADESVIEDSVMIVVNNR